MQSYDKPAPTRRGERALYWLHRDLGVTRVADRPSGTSEPTRHPPKPVAPSRPIDLYLDGEESLSKIAQAFGMTPDEALCSLRDDFGIQGTVPLEAVRAVLFMNTPHWYAGWTKMSPGERKAARAVLW